MSFDAFCEANSSLDISIHIKLTLEECKSGGNKAIEYTRTTKVSTPTGVKVTREKTLIEVTWKKNSSHGDVICIEKEGDKDHFDQEGNLLVTLKAS